MAKDPGAKTLYNILFQEYSDPARVITGREDLENRATFDKGISCHVFAIASPPTWQGAKAVNSQYENIGNERLFERIAEGTPDPEGEALEEERTQNMQDILAIREQQETVLEIDGVFLCGGFREGKQVPEHMWIEANGKTFDTFIDRNGIAELDRVGVEGAEFEPGCEGHPFEATDIRRVKVDGYTWGQLLAIGCGSEGSGYPDAIKDHPVVLAAKMAIEDAQKALSDYRAPKLIEAEQRMLDLVQERQAAIEAPDTLAGMGAAQAAIKKVVTDLAPLQRMYYESGLAKLATAAKEQREVARAAVGTAPGPFLERIAEAQRQREIQAQPEVQAQPEALVEAVLSSAEGLSRVIDEAAVLVASATVAGPTHD